MKRNSLLLLGTGVALGMAIGTTIHAQQTKVPAGYVVAQVEVNDPASFQNYRNAVGATLAPFGGKFLVRGGKITPVEGDPPKGNFVVIAFDSVEKAMGWENSSAYEAIKPIRHKAANSRVFVVEGVPPQ